MKKTDLPALNQITSLEEAFDLLNKHFFENKLPPVSIDLLHKETDIGPGYEIKLTPLEDGMTGNEIRYVCKCGNEVWGEPGIKVICNDCNSLFEEEN